MGEGVRNRQTDKQTKGKARQVDAQTHTLTYRSKNKHTNWAMKTDAERQTRLKDLKETRTFGEANK